MVDSRRRRATGSLLAARCLLPAFGCLLSALLAVGCGSSDPAEPEVTASIGGGGSSEPGTPASSGLATPVEKHQPTVVLETSLGSITVELDTEKAPLTVENFLAYVESGHYDETIFHQAVEGYMILGGGFTSELSEKPVQTAVRNEAHNGLTNRRGTIAMARQFDTIDSSTSQFFINLADNTALDHKGRTVEEYGYCVFGRVTAGMDVVDKIGKTAVRDVEDFPLTPVQPVVIKTVRRLH